MLLFSCCAITVASRATSLVFGIVLAAVTVAFGYSYLFFGDGDCNVFTAAATATIISDTEVAATVVQVAAITASLIIENSCCCSLRFIAFFHKFFKTIYIAKKIQI